MTRKGGRVLVRKAKPRKTPTSMNHVADVFSIARIVAHAASTMRKVRSASGLLNRNISTATGVRASTAPATRPARAPNWRLARPYRTPTLATPMTTCGKRIANEFRPKILTDSAMTHSDAGGLSTVIEFAPSKEPKKKATQFEEPAWAAAE